MAVRNIAPAKPSAQHPQADRRAEYSRFVVERVMASTVGQLPVLGKIEVIPPDAATATRWRTAAESAITALETFITQIPRASSASTGRRSRR